MSKVIRVEDGTYQELDSLKVARQTFDDIINELLNARLKMLEAISVLEGQLKYREWQNGKLKALQTANR